MADRARATFPWFLVGASLLFAAILLYVLFSAYLPAKQRVAKLEAELKGLYREEAELQAKLARQEQQHALREQQLKALIAERDELANRLDALARELAAAKALPARRR